MPKFEELCLNTPNRLEDILTESSINEESFFSNSINVAESQNYKVNPYLNEQFPNINTNSSNEVRSQNESTQNWNELTPQELDLQIKEISSNNSRLAEQSRILLQQLNNIS